MTDQLFHSITTVMTGILGIAILAVIVGTQSKTADVISAGGTAFKGILGTALSPVTGGSGGISNFLPNLGNLGNSFQN